VTREGRKSHRDTGAGRPRQRGLPFRVASGALFVLEDSSFRMILSDIWAHAVPGEGCPGSQIEEDDDAEA
jgi:hypothetical protein